ncbi:hypothetical protein GO816_09125 [Mucilaginibacter sp. HME9299]|uniref:Beta-galactosidase trimerisation domain-containing protein n=1 Tax=Mucilaginibacter aquatilis TaxID=1517760 RepID=A0A6I4I837_9SPHI|nr:hypothetical protein [Mucilaginibacter aquatilis]
MPAAIYPVERASGQSLQKTSFQASAPFSPDFDIRADVAMVYGINDDGGEFEKRVKGYRDKGYEVQFMTGIAWGQYKDYFLGEWDGKKHLDEGQMMQNGQTIWHGENVPYIVPTANFLSYMKTHVKRAIDAGVTAIYLEEPEFWARAGYSETFKKAWQKHYGFPWMAQHESPEATYLSSKLKYQLYFDALKEIFTYVKSYSMSIGRNVKCYVPTHSLLNYSSWQIVSPEASLANLDGMDGYIAQVWTGTSREPLFYNGIKKERVFENAFLEYGSMVSMTAPTGRRIYFLTDPIEDWQRSWDDYKLNYQATFTAQLLYPMVNRYEVMPWPNRIYKGKFKVEGMADKQTIAPAYATQMQVMINSLNSMPQSDNKLNGSHGISVLLSNSMMFQRYPTHKGYEDPQLSNFYGMAVPLLKHGIPVSTVHMENLAGNALKDTKVLIMSYANMKPSSASEHKHLADWVRAGGVLLYYGQDNDPFQQVKEWWNTGENKYNAPSEHLFKLLSINSKANTGGTFKFGKGTVYITKQDPKDIIMTANGHQKFIATVKQAYETGAKAGKFLVKNNFVLERGPYTIAAVLDESADSKTLELNGHFIDLFDPQLPVVYKKIVTPNTQAYLYDLKRAPGKQQTQVLASAARVTDEQRGKKFYKIIAKSPDKTINSMRILLPNKPSTIKVANADGALKVNRSDWDAASHTLLLSFDNFSQGVNVQINW